MTLRQLLEYGIEITGNVAIKKWIDKTETYRTLHSTTIFEQRHFGEFMDMEIKYMYSVEENGQGWLIIEVD